ncbi:MAG: RHS repeat-associated core domain-containing protein [Bacteroidales bacterium]|nr:RHS repeat-associated core domain-containing protein [Bacteroidales bacterium]
MRTENQDTTFYAFCDYQQNLLALTDVSGKPYARFSYDPWGNRRSATDWTQSDTLTYHIINRGYTLHEHLDEFGLINMNGRMYDPKLACFLSPDPVISDAGNWLDYNRYSYAWGNPLKYCDPTGMSETEGDHQRRRAEARHIPSTEELVMKCWYDTAVGQNANYVFSTNSYNSTETQWLNGTGYIPTVTVTASRPSKGVQGNPFEFADEQFAKFQSWNPTSYNTGGYGSPRVQRCGNSLQNFWNTSSVVNDGALAIAMGYNGMNNDIKRKAAYNISKKVPVKSGTLFQTAKSVAKGTVKVLGRASNVISGLSIVSDFVSGDANTSTLVDIGMLVGGAAVVAVAGASATPFVVGAGIVYGVGCMFGLDDYIDSQVDMSGVLNPFR